jgi:hypothetical protein
MGSWSGEQTFVFTILSKEEEDFDFFDRSRIEVVVNGRTAKPAKGRKTRRELPRPIHGCIPGLRPLILQRINPDQMSKNNVKQKDTAAAVQKLEKQSDEEERRKPKSCLSTIR